MDSLLHRCLLQVAAFYDRRKVGDVGALGFRRSTDLGVLVRCLVQLVQAGILRPAQSRFMDLGCADGRVNVLMSYLVRVSAGVELDEWTLEEYAPLRRRLEQSLASCRLPLPPDNIYLFHGDATDPDLHRAVEARTGLGFGDFDLYYTYLVMQAEFAEMLACQAKAGAVYMVYGLGPILPRLAGFELMETLSPMEGGLALYRKL